eukprot:4678052-Amphidinium_carterae.1
MSSKRSLMRSLTSDGTRMSPDREHDTSTCGHVELVHPHLCEGKTSHPDFRGKAVVAPKIRGCHCALLQRHTLLGLTPANSPKTFPHESQESYKLKATIAEIERRTVRTYPWAHDQHVRAWKYIAMRHSKRLGLAMRFRSYGVHAAGGGVDYREPVGWKKFAVRVMGQYEACDCECSQMPHVRNSTQRLDQDRYQR